MQPEHVLEFAKVTTISVAAAIVLGTVMNTVMEGRAVARAFDNMARQPSVADRIVSILLVSLAVIESTAIYVLLICLILLFANPFGALFGL